MPGQRPFALIPFLPARDLAATRDFYERELGLEVERDSGGCLIVRAESGRLGFRQAEPAGDLGSLLLLTFLTEDVDAAYRRLRRLGVETEDPPRRAGGAAYRFFARDPDGYRLEVRRG